MDCRKCNAQFSPTTHNQVYCSAGCRLVRTKNCQVCGARLKSSEVIDGQLRVLNRRTHCLSCKPWRGRVILTDDERIERNKEKCAVYYALHKTDLNAAQSKRKVETCFLKKKKLTTMIGGCQLCGYNKNQRNLAFHHLSDKKFNITANEFAYSPPKLAEELVKCICVCHNCHGEIHDYNYDSNKIQMLNTAFIEAVEKWVLLFKVRRKQSS